MSTANLTKVTVAKFALALVIVAGLIAGGFAAMAINGDTAVAAAPVFTGDVELDFPATDADVIIINDGAPVGDVGVPNDASFTAGWDMRDVRVIYDAATDELFVGMNFDGIAGDANGDGDPASGPITNTTAGGFDIADFGIDEAFSVIFDLDQDGSADIIAGVHDLTDITGFAVATSTANGVRNPAVEDTYLVPLPGNTGISPTNPSSLSPDIEFSITGFSTLVPNDSSPSFALSAFAGSFTDGGIGEEYVAAQRQFSTVELFTPAPALELQKLTNGVDADTADLGPSLIAGSTVTFTYEVTNTGNVPLVDVVIHDDILGEDLCLIEDIAVDATESCEATAIVTVGDYKNTGTAVGQGVDPAGEPVGEVTGTDPSHHTGLETSISIVKTIDGIDANEAADAVVVAVGSTVTFDFLVSNTGFANLTEVTVSDDVLGAIACPQSTLNIMESMTCSVDYVVDTEGLIKNIGSVSGQPVDGDGNPVGEPVTGEDPAHHSGSEATIKLEKATNGEDADDTAGPNVPFGDPVVFTYAVTNTSAFPIVDVVVTDDIEGEICTIELLAVDETKTCEFETTAGLGAYENNSDVAGQPVDDAGNPVGPVVTDVDPSHHFGECAEVIEGPALWKGAETIWETGLIAGDNSTIQIITSENGASPGQPNEQVYIEIAGVQYGPTPAGLGVLTFDVAVGGPVTVLHISEIDPSINGSNSVVPSLCGTDLTVDVPVCVDLLEGPALWKGAQTVWDTGLTAAAGSEIRIVTTENGASPAQPNEQVYIEIAGVQYGPTPEGLGELEFTVTDGGPVTVLHISEVDATVTGPNSVVPSICGTDLTPTPGPVCTELIEGPALYVGSQLVWDTGLVAQAGEPIRVVTTENGASPAQPNEQVYIRIGDEIYGPSPVGLGEITFTPTVSGPVSVLHYSVQTGDTSSPNSVVPALCGPGLGEPAPVCADFVEGPALYVGSDTIWHTSHYAKDNSQLRVKATENGDSPDQPNEKFFVQINGVTIGMSPPAPGEATFDIVDGGLVTIVHYSEVSGDTSSPNSVVPSLCGTDLVKVDGGLSCELPDGTAVEIPVPASFNWSSEHATAAPTWLEHTASSSAAWLAKQWERPVVTPDQEA